MDKADLLKQLLEGVTGVSGIAKNPDSPEETKEMTEEEAAAHNKNAIAKYSANIKKIGDDDLVRYLVTVENAIAKIINSNPSLTATNHNNLYVAIKVLNSVLDGKKLPNTK